MDAFNEVKLILIMYHLMLFTMFVPDPLAKFKIGYSCLAFMGMGLIINMTMMIVAPIVGLKRWCRINYHKRKAKKIDKELFLANKF